MGLHAFAIVEVADTIEYTSQWELRDIFGNQSLHYLAGRTEARVFANLLKDVSLRKRVSLMSLRNKAGVACKDIVNRGHMDHDFFRTLVLCDNEAIQLEGDRMIIKYDRKTAACSWKKQD